jgi:ubiquinol-cytochrome c reductase iron-sulfur subunit
MSPEREHASRGVVLAFALATLSAVGFAVSYALDLGNIAFGCTLGGAFAFLAMGLAAWSRRIDAEEPEYVEERAVGPSPPEEYAAFHQALTAQPVPRSRVLWSMLTVAIASIGGAALFPLRSLFLREGGDPREELQHTVWHNGRQLVTEDGLPIRASDLSTDSVMSAFPEGADLLESNGATLLIRVEPSELRLPPERMRWTVEGVVAYSKLCTHAGCPVGLYSDENRQLLCPCHHSIFDVLRGAVPVEGPATRPLPQLPLGVDEEGYLVALGDFTAPVGAGWWGYSK